MSLSKFTAMNFYDSKIKEVVNDAVETLSDTSCLIEDRTDSAEIIGSLGNESTIQFLCQSLDDPDPILRISIVKSLGNLCSRVPSEDGIQFLCKALKDPVPDVVYHAAISLGKAGDISILDILHETFDVKSKVIEGLISAIEMISSSSSLTALARHQKQIECLQITLEKTIKKIQIQYNYADVLNSQTINNYSC